MKTALKKQAGVALIEAMIAFLVVGIGIAGGVKMQSYLIKEAANSRDRAQATSLAEEKINSLRYSIDPYQYNNIAANGSENINAIGSGTIVRTQFERTWTYAAPLLTVTVSWKDREGSIQTVKISSNIAFINPATATSINNTVHPDLGHSFVQPPTGRAITGPIKLGAGENPTQISDSDIIDKANKFELSVGKLGNTYVLYKDGTILLKSTADEGFSTISGRVYVDETEYTKPKEPTRSNVYIVVSDASYCATKPGPTPASNETGYTAGTTTYSKYFEYTCFLGANWYGNVGVIRVDKPNTKERICVGKPNAATTPFNSPYPALSSIRLYRGFQANTYSGQTFYTSFGIGYENLNTNTTYTPAHLTEHDFLLTQLAGNPGNADCNPKLALKNDFSNNPGKYFCFPSNATCPDKFPVTTTPVVKLSGTISYSSISLTKVTSSNMTFGSAPCTVTTVGASSTYSCELGLLGFSASTWESLLSATLANTAYRICPQTQTGLETQVAAATAATSPANTWLLDLNGTINELNPTLNLQVQNTVCP